MNWNRARLLSYSNPVQCAAPFKAHRNQGTAMKLHEFPFHGVILVAIAILTTCNIARFLLNVAFIGTLDKALNSFLVDRARFPRDIPLRVQDAVMVFEPTELYDVHAVAQWESVSAGSGWIKLPTPQDDRPYAVSMYHQLHCLNFLRYDLTQSKKGVKPTPAVLGHANHCYNYIRMGIICGADRTLEPRIVEELTCENPKPAAPGVPHVCKDWAQIHGFVGHNYRENEEWLSHVVSGA